MAATHTSTESKVTTTSFVRASPRSANIANIGVTPYRTAIDGLRPVPHAPVA